MCYRVDLYWLPLGAGGHSVRFNGRVYEALIAAVERRERRDLYHAALELRTPAGRYVIEMTPRAGGPDAPTAAASSRAPSAAAWLGRAGCSGTRFAAGAKGGSRTYPRRSTARTLLTEDPVVAQRLLDLVPLVPAATWGRDELGAGEMWNSNSLISWLLVAAGIDIETVPLPAGGRAPGWDAGIAVATRMRDQTASLVGERAPGDAPRSKEARR